MLEAVDARNITEIGKGGFGKLIEVLNDRDNRQLNGVGWGGKTADLEALYPASAFAVVSEGLVRYKRQGDEIREDTDTLRNWSKVLSDGSKIYGQASEIDEDALKQQIKNYIESNGGAFDDSIDWQSFIKERSDRLKKRADAIDEVNR